MSLRSILEIDKKELDSFITDTLLEPRFRADQVWDWLYKKRVTSFECMTNISSGLKQALSQNFSFSLPQVVDKRVSSDGSIKLVLSYPEGKVECVLMPFEDRISLCLSTQIGCAVGCSFCYTATMGFVCNLKASQILYQFLVSNKISVSEFGRPISHVVYMGMGEPFLNYSNTIFSLERLTGSSYYNLSTRNITVSTSGICDKIVSFAHDSKCGLAISLGACSDAKRTMLMPINKHYGLERIKQALLDYQNISSKVITVEYILIGGVNCSLQDAKDLVRFLTYLKAKVNLIPLNASPNKNYSTPSETEIREFQQYLVKKRIPAPVRYSRAQDIYGACGQLQTLNQN